MKRLILTILLLVPTVATCQEIKFWLISQRMPEQLIEVDSAVLRVKYRYDLYLDIDKQIPQYDVMVLDVGSNGITRYWSWHSSICDSIGYQARHDQNNIRDGVNIRKWMDDDQFAICEDYLRNYPKVGTNTLQFSASVKEYYYSEAEPKKEWVIQGDTATILGYRCISATTKFRGREYTAWFTTDIPLNLGPWKLDGLPGLILRVEDTQGYFKWEAIGVENYSGEIYAYDKKFLMKSTRSDYRKLMKTLWSNPQLLTEAQGVPTYYYDNKTGEFEHADPVSFSEIPQLELN